MVDYFFLVSSLVVLSLLHVLGEVLYKVGGMGVDKNKDSVNGFFLKNDKIILFMGIIIFSLAISMGIKAIYGIIIGDNPLSVVAGIYFGLIGIYSIIFGKFFFHERIYKHQYFGFILIFAGIIFMVI